MGNYAAITRPPAKGAPSERDKGSEIPRAECEKMRLADLSGAQAILDIEQNFAVVMNAPTLGALWKRMARAHPV